MHQVCRTCLKEIPDDKRFILTEDAVSTRIKNELSVCIPEIDVYKAINPVVCFQCVQSLHSAYVFKTQCLQTETRIDNYMSSTDLNDPLVQRLGVSRVCRRSTVTEAATKGCPTPSTYDIIDDLNNLLDEALSSVPKCEAHQDKNKNVGLVDCIYDQRSVTTEKITENKINNDVTLVDQNEVQKITRSRAVKNTVVAHNSMKEGIVTCMNLPDKIKCSKVTKVKVKKRTGLMESSRGSLKTETASSWKPHKKKHAAEELFACTVCPYRCAYKHSFERHLTIHSNDKPFACDRCSYRCGYRALLNRHLKNVHKSEYKAVPTPAPIISCTMCPYKNVLKTNVIRHIKSKHAAKSLPTQPFYACKLCAYEGASEHLLRRHTRRNHPNGLPKLTCHLCSFKTVYKHSLNRHLKRTHKVNVNNEALEMFR